MTALEQQSAEALKKCLHVVSGQETNKRSLVAALEHGRDALKEFERQRELELNPPAHY